MAITYKVIERGQPGVVGGGKKKFYASVNSDGEMNLNGLTKRIEKISTVSGADIRAVVYAKVDVMKDSLEEGKIVRMGELGSLRVGISSNGEKAEKDVSANSIKSAKVIFNPSQNLKEMLKTLKYVKA